jgi:hypothetical protein
MDQNHHQEKCLCARNKFCNYVQKSDQFSDEEKKYLASVIVNDGISEILYVSTVLVGWALIAGIIESILFPGIIVYAIFHGIVDYKVITPPVIFLVGNLLLKLSYIAYNLRGKINTLDIFITALPYAGSAYLLKKFLINDKIMYRAVGIYLKDKKNQLKQKLLTFIHLSNKSIL